MGDNCEEDYEGDYKRQVSDEHNDIDSDMIKNRSDQLDLNDMKKLSFKTAKECEEFYHSYAKMVGFGVRLKARSCNRKTGFVTALHFVCDREGLRSEKNKNRQDRKRKARDETRCDCKAMIKFSYDKHISQYKVKEFKKLRNHEYVHPNLVNLIPVFRGIDPVTKAKINELYELGFGQKQIYSKLVHDAGGHDNIGCVEKDVYNAVDQHRRQLQNDAEAVLAYLEGKRESDPLFFMRYTLDKENKLEKLFWCDGRSRIDYAHFGHTMAFDTTYKSNKYNKPFTMFVGINNHWQTIPFGCAIILDEKKETYIWVLKQLLKAMDGRKPATVMTDRDSAMANAIEEVMPEACHRVCLWHLLKNVVDNAGSKFSCGFIRCVDKYRTPEDFEKGWEELLRHYKIDMERHKWAADIYKIKEKWVEAFLQGYFFGGMRSTQRCKSMNRKVKAFVNKRMKLYQFVRAYERGVAEIRYQELNFDFKSKYSVPAIGPPLMNIKRDAAQVYTRVAYEKFYKELTFEASFVVKEKHETNGFKFYRLEESDKCYATFIESPSMESMQCCCMKLQFVGFPCRHMIAVMKHEQMNKIPRGCIVKRWTIHARPDVNFNLNEDPNVLDQHVVNMRYAYLMSAFIPLCNIASKKETIYKATLDGWLKCKHEDIGGLKDSGKRLFGDIKNPATVDTKGRKKKKTLRACGNCAEKGHTKRNCPKLQSKGLKASDLLDLDSPFMATEGSHGDEEIHEHEDESMNGSPAPPKTTFHPHINMNKLDDDTVQVDWISDLNW